ncbi:MAG TPA: hypothetical protein VMT55_01840, partial [Candidatus Sulfotelmatobacter sp.]|nr:hypothetical protein [Candidatus Sulfotelmatobacter sp.]
AQNGAELLYSPDSDQTGGLTPATAAINPPVVPDKPGSQEFRLTRNEFKELDALDPKVKYTIVKIEFTPDPTTGVTAEYFKKSFNLTDSQVKALPLLAQERYTVTVPNDQLLPPSFSQLALDPADEPAKDRDLVLAQRTAMLKAAGFGDLDKLPGTLYFHTTQEENGGGIKEYFIYWLANKENVSDKPLLLFRGVMKDGKLQENHLKNQPLPPPAQAYLRSLQRLLHLSGALPELRDVDRIDRENLQRLYSYLLGTQTLLRPSLDEYKRNLKAKQEELVKKEAAYNNIENDKALDQAVKSRLQRDLAMESMEISNGIFELLKQIGDDYGESVELLDYSLDLPQKSAVSLMRDDISQYTRAWLDRIIGLTPDGRKPEQLLFYANSVIPAEKKLENLFKERDKKVKKEDKQTLEIEIQEARHNLANIYGQLYQFERTFSRVAGVKERCAQIRQEIKTRLVNLKRQHLAENAVFTALDGEIQAVDGREARPSHEDERLQSFGEKVNDFAPPQGDDKEASQKVADKQYQFDKARFLLADVLTDNAARSLVAPLLKNFTADGDVALGLVLDSFSRVNDKLTDSKGKTEEEKEKKMLALGRYLWMQEFHSRQENDTIVRQKTTGLAEAAKPALDEIDKQCAWIKDTTTRGRVKKSLESFILQVYRYRLTLNYGLPADGKITFGKVDAVLQNLHQHLPPLDRTTKEVFKALADLPEDRELAAIELNRKANSELAKATVRAEIHDDRVAAESFNRSAKEGSLITPRIIADIADKAGSRVSAQVFTAATLRAKFGAKFTEPDGNY